MSDVNKYDDPIGLLKRGYIAKYDRNTNILKIKLANSSAIKGQSKVTHIDVQAPHSLFYNNGLFIGALPAEGTPVIIGQGHGGQYHLVSTYAENLSNFPTLSLGQILLKSNDNTNITLDLDNNIYLGSYTNNIHIDTKKDFITTTFASQNNFTDGSRKIEGVIKRDLLRNKSISPDENKLESDLYDSLFSVIGMDPSSSITSGVSTSIVKNPPLIELREQVYELEYASDIDDDLSEAAKYNLKNNAEISTSNYPNRRKSRADVLSLSLVSPNFLIETVKGTVVDIFGNILDLNRYSLPVGKEQNTINKDRSKDKSASFALIKELERKSLAYHFEINARKDLKGKSPLDVIDSSDNYARDRSRFFFDVDKEGQFKLNVPASSEKGNVPLLTRYENYSTFSKDENGKYDPNKLIFDGAGNDFDIYQDSFGCRPIAPGEKGFYPITSGVAGSISLKTGDGGDAAPIDRLNNLHIKHGTAYHDIVNTCYIHQSNQFINYQCGTVIPLTVDISPSAIPFLKDVVSTTIITSGDNANSGGRSGQLNFDGSIELNVGANTVDRQSMWIDMAGGMVANIGKDNNNNSVVMSTGGNFIMQVGGFTVLGDSRFSDTSPNSVQQSIISSAVLDLRIMTSGGFCHMIRCDDNGITIMTPNALKIHATGNMTLTSDQNISIECENLKLQNRVVNKESGGSI